jgi:metal transporter CNNM
VILSADTILDHKAVDAMFVQIVFIYPSLLMRSSSLLSGYSRFPVHEPNNPFAFVGLLLVKKVLEFCSFSTFSFTELIMQLLTYDPSKALPVSSFQLSILPEALPSINCFQALDYLYVTSTIPPFIHSGHSFFF